MAVPAGVEDKDHRNRLVRIESDSRQDEMRARLRRATLHATRSLVLGIHRSDFIQGGQSRQLGKTELVLQHPTHCIHLFIVIQG